MIALEGAALSAEVPPKAENTSHSGHENTTGQPVNAAASPKPRRFLTGAITKLFRQLAEVVTLKPPQVQQRRKRRREETRRGFMAVQNIMRWIRRPRRPEPERLWLADTLDWLQLWHEEPATAPDPEPTRPDSFNSSDDFSPDL